MAKRMSAEQFRDFAQSLGYELPPRIEPGRRFRFSTNGKRGDSAGWGYLFPDERGGIVGDWRTGGEHVWQAKRERRLTAEEFTSLQIKIEHQKREAQAQRDQEQEAAAAQAKAILDAAQPATSGHPYLRKKRIAAYPGLRVGKWPQRGKENCLLVPMRDVGGKLWNVQAIFPEKDPELGRDKDFLADGRKKGLYLSIGEPKGKIVIAEGYATGAAIVQSTGEAVAIAFDAYNLGSVAQELKRKVPSAALVIAADNDTKNGKPNIGLEKAQEAARAVGALVAVPEMGKACDFADLYLERGANAVKAAIQGARRTEQKQESSDMQETLIERSWPATLKEDALHGLAGELVQVIAPHTEADPAAILLQVLVSFGALVGRGPHVKVEGDKHHANLNALIVGDTSKARKGTSWGRVRQIYEPIGQGTSEGWPKVVHGLSSGEGLKWEVRDAIKKHEHDGACTVERIVDSGVADKRLLVVEAEFAQVLRQCVRSGNTLSPTLRCAWDGLPLQTLTKNDPITATGAHISIIGHIVADELRAELTQTDSANGFANRFLFMCAQRSKKLPFGGEDLPEQVISQFAARIARAAGTARTRQEMKMDDGARAIWEEVYGKLSEGKPGLIGAVTARAEAQCLRLALVYALMDEADSIQGEHLLAALAVWDRCEDSAGYIFGSALGDPKADEILRALIGSGEHGMTRTQISALFNRHASAERIGAALQLLQRHGMAYSMEQQTSGAPREVWMARSAKQANKAKEAPERVQKEAAA